ncbi:MFS transporter [Novacetimonas pomaceti]|uniref:Major facilitator superfamily (MFS) profile domain-containing protein n=1 Tax=Novacetimonas pomaceti TaxID=2021998 RepID=A0ABX5P5Z8_9PROT|nr:MFS transporter [Novacetimonas pomaceti]MBV1834514.1 MFS transporter [Novacetimonas pomaceti]PYD49217.1 hypothetical protein C3920_00265 [Novacetimonas pomaceti]
MTERTRRTAQAGTGPRMQRDLALYAARTFISVLGSMMVPVALSFALFARGAGAGRVSAVLTAEALPMALFMLVGGVVADRLAPRRIMMAADLLRAGAQGVLAMLLIAGNPSFIALLVLAALVGTGTAFDTPGRNRLLTQIVAPDRLAAANSVVMIATSLAVLLGPAVGGVLVAGMGAGWAIALDALSYLISAVLLLCLRPVTRQEAQTRTDADLPLPRALREGWGEFVRRPWVWLMVCLFGLIHMLSWGPTEVLGALVFAHRPGGAPHWGGLLALMGLGALIGGGIALRVRPARPIRAVLLWFLVYPLGPVSIAVSLPYWMQGACFLLGGMQMANVNVIWEGALQRAIPPDRLSRVSAYDAFGSFCLLPLGYAISGPLALMLGVSGTLWLGAGCVWLFTVLLLCRRDMRDAASMAE